MTSLASDDMSVLYKKASPKLFFGIVGAKTRFRKATGFSSLEKHKYTQNRKHKLLKFFNLFKKNS